MVKLFFKVVFVLLVTVSANSCVNNTNGKIHSSKQNQFQEKETRLPLARMHSIKQYTTAAKGGLRFSKTEDFIIARFEQPDEHFPTIMIDAKKRFQKIVGFGGALTDAAAETFFKLPKAERKALLTAYFDKEKGIGYSLCRIPMHSCDFSSKSYSYDEADGDTALKYFSIAPDKKFKLPFIKMVQETARGEISFFTSPWSPPAWMKTNHNMLEGGKLKPRYQQSWANYFVRFFQAYQKEGISFWGMTVQNEPMAVQRWESCIYTAAEERDFVKNYLGPTLAKNGMGDKKIMIWDHNRGLMYQRAEIAFDDSIASKYIWGVGFHWYSGNHFENVKLLNEAFPDKKMLFTEGCVFPFDINRLGEWHWGEQYGRSIINDLNNSASGWVDWNILLNEKGGPNHVGNYCYAPVIGNTKTGKLSFMSSYYYLGHFSKFIRPGARRIICSSNDDNLLATAFINPDSTIVVVAMNPSASDKEFKLWMNGMGTLSRLPAHGICTLIINSL
jgi:glucosylceramidase